MTESKFYITLECDDCDDGQVGYVNSPITCQVCLGSGYHEYEEFYEKIFDAAEDYPNATRIIKER